jgi:hypothetical protein
LDQTDGKPDVTKSRLYGGWGNTIQPTSQSDVISKTNNTDAIRPNLMKFYYLRRGSLKLMYAEFELFSTFQSFFAEIKYGTKFFQWPSCIAL